MLTFKSYLDWIMSSSRQIPMPTLQVMASTRAPCFVVEVGGQNRTRADETILVCRDILRSARFRRAVYKPKAHFPHQRDGDACLTWVNRLW